MTVLFNGDSGPVCRTLEVLDLGNVAVNTVVDFRAATDIALTLDASVTLTLVFPEDNPGAGFRLKITQGAGAPFVPTFAFAGGPILAPGGSLGSFSASAGQADGLAFVNRRTELWVFKSDDLSAI